MLEKDGGLEIDYACISSQDDFANISDSLPLKFTFVCDKLQLSKLCDFLSNTHDALGYDWYVKTRPEIILYEPIKFDSLKPNCINARIRHYKGPDRIVNGSSVGGEGGWDDTCGSVHQTDLEYIILDDQFYIFDRSVISNGGFAPIDETLTGAQSETFHSNIWKSRKIDLHPIGIHLEFRRENGFSAFSGPVNIRNDS